LIHRDVARDGTSVNASSQVCKILVSAENGRKHHKHAPNRVDFTEKYDKALFVIIIKIFPVYNRRS